MKKLALLLVALLVAAPAFGALEITASHAGLHVTIGYTGAGTDPATRVRGFGLDISPDSGAIISGVTTSNTDYYIYPGTILIDAEGVVTYAGTPNAPEDDPGEKDPGITIEMASLWATNDTNGHTTPPPTSGTLVEFDVDKECKITISANTLRTGIILEDGTVVVANLPFDHDVVAVTYTLDVDKVGSGTVEIDSVLEALPYSDTHAASSVVDLEAFPAVGWQFDNWSGDLTGNDNPDTVTMDGNKSVVANFSEIPVVQYTLTTHVVGSGSVTGAGTYDEDTVVPVEAIPDPGWDFDSWSGDLGGSVNPESITMTSNKDVTATFVEQCFPVAFTTYADWVTLGKPDCWCNSARGGTGAGDYQCDGDADGVYENSWFKWQVYQADYDLVAANWKKTIDDPTLDPCADIDHKFENSWFKWRVYQADYDIVAASWKRIATTNGGDLPGDCGMPSRPE